MPQHPLSDNEKDILKVIKNEIDYAQCTPSIKETKDTLETRIAESEVLLRSIGCGDEVKHITVKAGVIKPKAIVVRSFDDLLKDANQTYPNEISFEDIFTRAELDANTEYIRKLNAEFNAIHKLDAVDITIPVVAGILSGAIDCIFGGFVRDASGRNIPGSMSEFVSKLFDNALPADRIKKLEDLV